MNELSAAVLCGGRSRRMGRDKASLPWQEGELLDTVLRALSGLGKVYLSADTRERFSGRGFPVIEDRYPGSGPLGGVCSSLLACGTPLLFVVCCDMPFVTGAVGRALQARMDSGTEAAVPRDTAGRLHPLCAVYRREAAPILVKQLQTGNFRMRDALRCLRTQFALSQELPGGERVLTNLNTLKEYRALPAILRTEREGSLW